MAKTLCNRNCSAHSCFNKLFLTAILFAALFQSCSHKSKEIRILFVGDILLSRNVEAELKDRKSSPWRELKKLFSSADLVIGNLEGAVGNARDSWPSKSGSPVFAIPKSYIPMLSEAGFKALSVENNHSNDLGAQGRNATISELIQNGIMPLSFRNSPQFYKIQNYNIALIAINLIPDRNNSLQQIPSVEIQQKLRLAKNLSNMVIVFIHWGSELLEWPNQRQREGAEWLIENGADLIIGCHPHVVQQCELVNGKPVFFSLGNHLFDQKYLDTKEGLMVDCKIKDGSFNCKGIITHTAKNSFYPQITGNKDYSFPAIKLSPCLQVSNVSLTGTKADMNNDRVSLQGHSNQRFWTSPPVSLVSISTGLLDGIHPYLFTLERHYSNMDGSVDLRPYVYSVSEKGLMARWRGSALAWPLLDAVILPEDNRFLCALHRGNSFINLYNDSSKARILAYKWNGFGFSGVNDTAICKKCQKYFAGSKP